MGGSAGGGGKNYDPVYNAGILALSEEEQEWAGEYVNFYKHGVSYDPNEKGYVNPKTGKWVPMSEAPTKTFMGHEHFDLPGGVDSFTTRGETEGFDFDNPPVSYMSMEQDQLAANHALLPQITESKEAQIEADISTASLQNHQAITGSIQTRADRALITGVNPTTGTRIGPGAIAVGGAQQERDLAMLEADTRNIPYSEDSARERYLTEGEQSKSNRAIIPSAQNAVISGYDYQTGMNEAQQGLISPWTQAVLSDYQYQTGKNRAETGLLPGYQKATQSGYDLTYDQNTADRELMPYYQDAAQAGYQASEAGSKYSKGRSEADTELLPAYQKAAQSNYDLSYDTSEFGREKISGQTPIMNRYFDKVNKGVDVGGKINSASADVASSWKGANTRTNMALEGMGIDPSSNRGRKAFSKSNMEYGRQLTSARQTARNQAEGEDINRMETALSM